MQTVKRETTMPSLRLAVFLAAVSIAGVGFAGPASASCMTKAAEATAGDEKSAKWFALETMVQAVSWSLWPSFVANGTVPGYTIKDQKYRCNSGGAGVTCRGQATFCKS